MKKNIIKFAKKRQSVKNTHTTVTIPRSLHINTFMFKMDLDIPVYFRTGQTTASFAIGSQVTYVNMAALLTASNSFTKQFLTAGSPMYELTRLVKFNFIWNPSVILPVTATYEPQPFDLRYVSCYDTDTVLPSGYAGNFNTSHLKCLLSQTNRQQSFKIHPPAVALMSDSNRQCLGQWISGFNLASYGSQLSGILILLQVVPGVNSVAIYNPKLGYIKCVITMECLNTFT